MFEPQQFERRLWAISAAAGFVAADDFGVMECFLRSQLGAGDLHLGSRAFKADNRLLSNIARLLRRGDQVVERDKFLPRRICRGGVERHVPSRLVSDAVLSNGERDGKRVERERACSMTPNKTGKSSVIRNTHPATLSKA